MNADIQNFDLKTGRTYLASDVLKNFEKGFECSSTVSATPKSRNFVKRFVATLEKRNRNDYGECVADDEFLKCYARENTDSKKWCQSEEDFERMLFEEEVLNNRRSSLSSKSCDSIDVPLKLSKSPRSKKTRKSVEYLELPSGYRGRQSLELRRQSENYRTNEECTQHIYAVPWNGRNDKSKKAMSLEANKNSNFDKYLYTSEQFPKKTSQRKSLKNAILTIFGRGKSKKTTKTQFNDDLDVFENPSITRIPKIGESSRPKSNIGMIRVNSVQSVGNDNLNFENPREDTTLTTFQNRNVSLMKRDALLRYSSMQTLAAEHPFYTQRNSKYQFPHLNDRRYYIREDSIYQPGISTIEENHDRNHVEPSNVKKLSKLQNYPRAKPEAVYDVPISRRRFTMHDQLREEEEIHNSYLMNSRYANVAV
ncbi:uncharacterized protein LOC107268508 [Cephus cinctus]|uniref:Uncharacterized protein LOC107268508 n=1 Tax=Cephus cinctus TaxID=211228 RepID=A0AAJ7BYF4_CEPCN|nr:uncharacterized protein LOC107268508 [Cephus cinctus]